MCDAGVYSEPARGVLYLVARFLDEQVPMAKYWISIGLA